ncbi:MAG: type II secretion system protein GspD, partial [Chlamydiia bacterium]|nr:type II secretion system protein GspD [Chlamydiia bacterium]
MKIILFAAALAALAPLSGQTIAEKKAGLKRSFSDLDPQTERSLIKVNDELSIMQTRLNELYADVQRLHQLGGTEEEFKALLDLINRQRAEIRLVSEEWQRTASDTMRTDIYALWHQPETTVEQLVIDFGSQNFVYVMGPEIAEMRLSVNSNIPIPRAAWEGMLEQILNQNGIGTRQLNPFLRELYVIGDQPGPVKFITNQASELEFLPDSERVAFILSPDPTEVRRVLAFLEKFVNTRTTTMDQLGRQILLISTAAELRDLLKLYDFAADNTAQQMYKLVPLHRIPAKEMARVI